MRLEIRGLKKSFEGRQILRGLDLVVEKGEILAVLGVSGAGKSTLLRLIAGLEVADEGEILLNGKVATSGRRILISPHKRRIGFIFQDLGLWEHLSVEEHLAFVFSARGVRDQEALERLLRFFDLLSLRNKRPATLSGGERQRLALARALAQEPEFLLLDEPFSNLDLPRKKRLHREFLRVRETQGLGMIYVTHDPLDVRLLSDRVAVLHEGYLVQIAPYERLLSEPAHPIVTELLVY